MDELMETFKSLGRTIQEMTVNATSATQTASPVTEPSALPSNPFPAEVDNILQAVPGQIIDNIAMDSKNVKPPLDLEDVLDDLLASFSEDEPSSTQSKTDLLADAIADNANAVEIAQQISDETGQTFVKVLEDATGKTVQIYKEEIFEVTPDMPKLTNNATEALNATFKDIDSTETNYTNVYIIAALVVLMVLSLSAGLIWWFRKNRSLTEKSNKYPVMTVVNNEYMDPHTLKSGNKFLKNLP